MKERDPLAPKLRITYDDLASPHVDEVLERQKLIRAMAAQQEQIGFLRRFLFSSMFYTAIVGMLGALIGWAILEPVFEDLTTISGVVRETLPSHTVGVCEECGKGIPLDPASSGTGTCPACGKNLQALPLEGVIRLEKILVGVIPGKTKITAGGKTRRLQSAAEIGPGKEVRFTGAVAGKNSLICLRAEPDAAGELPGEPDLEALQKRHMLAALFWFAVIGGLIALMIGGVEGIASLNMRQSVICGLVGLGIGFAGGLIGIFPAGLLYALSSQITFGLVESSGQKFLTIEDIHGSALFAQIVGRSMAWGVVGLALALGQGTARRSKKLIINGLIGGCVGGLLGGLFFDPIAKLGGAEGAEVSRCIGFLTVGFMIGLLIGLVEHLSKEAWLLLRTGPLTGKQFVVHKREMTIGSSPRADIYLFREPAVGAEHARLMRLGRTYEIESVSATGGALVNGEPVQKRVLRDGDVITVGSTELEFRSRGA